MKKKDRYKLINYAMKEYSEIFKHDYKFQNLSCKDVKNLLYEYRHSGGATWDYCCYGLYCNCWQDPFGEGIWDATQKNVDKLIMNYFECTKKECRKDSRIGVYKDDTGVHVIIIARDLPKHKCDYLFTFTNTEGLI